MFKKILIAFDGSDESLEALDLAAEMAQKFGSGVIVTHSLLREASHSDLQSIAQKIGCADEFEDKFESTIASITPTAGHGVTMATTLLVPDTILRKLGERLTEFAKKRLDKKEISDVQLDISDDSPDSAILEVAGVNSVDLIAMGSRGFGNLKSLVLGSVSQKVLKEAQCPCLITQKSVQD